jgi:hypothetical protein
MLKFEMNGKAYETDRGTLMILRGVIAYYRAGGSKDASAIAAIMELGTQAGVIRESKL